MNKFYKLIEFEEASPKVKEIYQESKVVLGVSVILNWFKYQGNDENTLSSNWTKLKKMLTNDKVPNVIKQMTLYNISDFSMRKDSTRNELFANQMEEALSLNFKSLNQQVTPLNYKTAVKILTKAALIPSTFNNKELQQFVDAGFSEKEIKDMLEQVDLTDLLSTIADIAQVRLENTIH